MTGLALARATWGTALVTVPRLLLSGAGGRGAVDDRAVAVARVLGVRHLLQAALTSSAPGRGVLLAGAVGDLAHAASMVVLARVDRDRRRVALVDAVVATGWGAASWTAARGAR